MRNIQAHVPKKVKGAFAAKLKEIWLAPNKDMALERAKVLSNRYSKRFPKATESLENGLEDSLYYYAFSEVDARKISSTNMLGRLNKEIRRRTNQVGIFPNEASYLRLVTTNMMEYAKDWSATKAYISPVAMETMSKLAWLSE